MCCQGLGSSRHVDAEDVQDDEMFRVEPSSDCTMMPIAKKNGVPQPEPDCITVSVVKMKLAHFCKTPDFTKRLNNVVINLNQAMGCRSSPTYCIPTSGL